MMAVTDPADPTQLDAYADLLDKVSDQFCCVALTNMSKGR